MLERLGLHVDADLRLPHRSRGRIAVPGVAGSARHVNDDAVATCRRRASSPRRPSSRAGSILECPEWALVGAVGNSRVIPSHRGE
jgi:hypothetical protein